MNGYRETLCWKCKKATGGCSWSKKLVPVEGWDAEPMAVRNSRYYKTRYGIGKQSVHITESYHVKSCPLFEEDE